VWGDLLSYVHTIRVSEDDATRPLPYRLSLSQQDRS